MWPRHPMESQSALKREVLTYFNLSHWHVLSQHHPAHGGVHQEHSQHRKGIPCLTGSKGSQCLENRTGIMLLFCGSAPTPLTPTNMSYSQQEDLGLGEQAPSRIPMRQFWGHCAFPGPALEKVIHPLRDFDEGETT